MMVQFCGTINRMDSGKIYLQSVTSTSAKLKSSFFYKAKSLIYIYIPMVKISHETEQKKNNWNNSSGISKITLCIGGD